MIGEIRAILYLLRDGAKRYKLKSPTAFRKLWLSHPRMGIHIVHTESMPLPCPSITVMPGYPCHIIAPLLIPVTLLHSHYKTILTDKRRKWGKRGSEGSWNICLFWSPLGFLPIFGQLALDCPLSIPLVNQMDPSSIRLL